MTRALAVDPGLHVGVAYWDGENGDEGRSWEETPDSFYDALEAWIKSTDVVICENFVISGRRAREANVTIEQIGVIRYLCRRHDRKLVLQAPGAGKHFAGTSWEKLRRLGWYVPGPDHRNSAAAHLVLYLVTAGLLNARDVIQS